MESGARKIEIFAPFGEALDLTKAILFRPFDLAKWCAIGFTAFLAGLADGTRIGIPNPTDFSGKATTEEDAPLGDIWQQWFSDSLTVAIFVGVALVVVALIVLCMWLGSRGRFMLIDCIVRNRGAVVEPWREWRREGNSFFGFNIALVALNLVLIPVIALPFLLPWLTHGHWGEFAGWKVVYVVLAVLMLLVFTIGVAVMLWFAVPVMYRQRCGVIAACRIVLQLAVSYPVPIVLYVLFVAVLWIGGAVLSCLAMCVTCCLAALPYIGTVILLPLYVFYYSYTLLFLRQFGPEYDVWSDGLPAHVIPSPSIELPTVEPPSNNGPASSEPPPLPGVSTDQPDGNG